MCYDPEILFVGIGPKGGIMVVCRDFAIRVLVKESIFIRTKNCKQLKPVTIKKQLNVSWCMVYDGILCNLNML